ncbi:MAG TPA: BMP family ABC transporter substrate-binding protein [Candidatus Scatosoma pullicola]|nr:BMP family ABC transporter substrate-binding protein [Candidatus Scatosoma pullicola]
MKKFATVALSAVLAATGLAGLTACSDRTYTIGLICLHGDSSTYDKNFIDAMREACENLGVSDQLTIVTDIPEGNECYEAARDLVDQGCQVIFADSFGHEQYMLKAAREFPDVEFCHATGTQAHTSEVANYHNAFASIYEGRYLAGVAAGMKLLEMHEAGELEDNNYTDTSKTTIKMGYVGAFPYAEVISGYTSFFLGAQSVLQENELDVTMEVSYTSSWYDIDAERDTAIALINRGAALISQHADSMGAPSACEDKGVPNVSYNGSTATDCPNTYIISSRVNWVPYFEYMIRQTLDNAEIDTDWCGGLGTGSEYTDTTGSVVLTELGSAAAEGTEAKLNEVRAKLQKGELEVFDTSKFTVKGEHITSYLADVDDAGDYVGETEAINAEGIFEESKYRSAPYFNIIIDGITEYGVAE